MKALFARRLTMLAPADDAAREAVNSLSAGELVMLEVRRPRNLAFHRKFFGLVQIVFENQERFSTVERLLTAIKLEAGWYEDGPVEAGGKITYLPKSISFARMDALEFERFYREALDAITRLLPHLNAEDLEGVVAEFAA